jgi:Flp pilus assembly protein TadD
MSRVHIDPETGNGLVVLANADPYGFMVTRGAHCAWVKADYDVSFDRFCQESAAALAAAAFDDTTATAAIEQVRTQRKAHPDRIYVDQAEFNWLGYRLLDQHRVHHAIQVFRWNVDLHPDAWNAYDSLGEAYVRAGKHEKAIQNYEQSLDLNPDNDNARRMLDKLTP